MFHGAYNYTVVVLHGGSRLWGAVSHRTYLRIREVAHSPAHKAAAVVHRNGHNFVPFTPGRRGALSVGHGQWGEGVACVATDDDVLRVHRASSLPGALDRRCARGTIQNSRSSLRASTLQFGYAAPSVVISGGARSETTSVLPHHA